MVRVYGLDNMTVEDYRKLYQRGTVPTPEQLSGLWKCVPFPTPGIRGSWLT